MFSPLFKCTLTTMKGEKGVRDSELKTEGKRKSSLSTPEKKDLTHYFVLHE